MTKQHARPSVMLWAAMLALSMLCTAQAGAQDASGKAMEWKLSTAVGPAYALGEAGNRWAKRIIEKAGGRLAVKVFPGASLAGREPHREFAALRDGAADLAVGSTLFWSTQVAALNAIGLPWIAPDAKSLDALLTGAMKERLDAAIESAGAVPLAYAALGQRALATTAQSVQTPVDLHGLKVRTTATPLVEDLFFAMGAEPKTLAFADAQAALKAGTLDAQEGTAAAFAATRLDALGVRHVLLWGAIGEVAVFAVNRAAWTALTDDERAIVRETAQQVAAELPALARAEEDGALAELAKRGVGVTRLTATGRAAFAFAARPAYDKWAALAGADLVRAAEAQVAGAPP